MAKSAAQRGPKDNTHMGSFFHSLKEDLIHGTSFGSARALRGAVRRYMGYYNRQPLHSALAYRSPVPGEAAAAQDDVNETVSSQVSTNL